MEMFAAAASYNYSLRTVRRVSLSALRGIKTITPADNLNSAVASLQPGDTLQLHAGSYGSINNTTIKGTSGAKITIKSFPGEIAQLTDISVSGGAYITFENLSMRHVWFGNGTKYCRVQGGEVKGSPEQGIHVPHIADEHNEFIGIAVHHNGTHSTSGTPWDHGFYIAGRYTLIDSCDVYSNWGNGLQVYNGYGERADGNIIQNCKFHNNGTGGFAAGISVGSGSGNQVLNNNVYSNPRDIDIAWNSPRNTIVRGNRATSIYINSDASGTLVENNCIDAAKIDNRGSGTVARNNSASSCSGGSVVVVDESPVRLPSTEPLIVPVSTLPPAQETSSGGFGGFGTAAMIFAVGFALVVLTD